LILVARVVEQQDRLGHLLAHRRRHDSAVPIAFK
jgi:hypothetical protein